MHSGEFVSLAGAPPLTTLTPSKIPQPGAADTDGLRAELRKTKADLQQAVERCQELAGAAHVDAQAPTAHADMATSPMHLDTADHGAHANVSAPHLIQERANEAPSPSVEHAAAAKAAATAVRFLTACSEQDNLVPGTRTHQGGT